MSFTITTAGKVAATTASWAYAQTAARALSAENPGTFTVRGELLTLTSFTGGRRDPAAEYHCRHCRRPIFRDPAGDPARPWNLVYREYAETRSCDARGDGATLSTLPHEPEGSR